MKEDGKGGRGHEQESCNEEKALKRRSWAKGEGEEGYAVKCGVHVVH